VKILNEKDAPLFPPEKDGLNIYFPKTFKDMYC
jgi:hypothetical protein